jgi:hypothetical protein
VPTGDAGWVKMGGNLLVNRHFESLRVGDHNETGVVRSWLPFWLIARYAASGSALRRRDSRDDLVGITLEDDGLTVDEYDVVMALADLPPDNEIPTPNLLFMGLREVVWVDSIPKQR